jgi:tetratricopeptide (TPR) repeat protein
MYEQEVKKQCRRRLIKHAITALTTERSSSVCVQRDHVRRVWEQQKKTVEVQNTFAENIRKKIDDEIGNWELFHDSQVQTKKASDLRVCYLSGDDPTNDLKVLVENGVLCQNVWAIEKDDEAFEKGLKNVAQSNMRNIRLFKGDFLTWLKDFEEQFDIIYFDACGTLPSKRQKTLKAIGYIFLYNKLTSPGALITNFSFPPEHDENEIDAIKSERNRFDHITNHYLRYRLRNTKPCNRENILDTISIEESYGDYITFQVIDSACLYIPAYRMLSSDKQSESLWDQIFKEKEVLKIFKDRTYENEWMYNLSKTIKNCNESLCKTWAKEIFPDRQSLSKLLECKLCFLILTNPFLKSDEQNVRDIEDFGNKYLLKKILQPLTVVQALLQSQRVPFINLVLEVLYSQMAYPSFPVVNKSLRLKYTAKKRQMFCDVFIMDKCRYLYEQFPSVHLFNFDLKEAWLVVFCMVANGLQKHIGDVYSNMYHKEISTIFQGVHESADSHYYIPDREVLDFKYFSENGIRLEEEGNLAEAIECYNACKELRRDDTTIYTNIASCYLKMNMPYDVLANCEKALELESNNVKALYMQAMAWKTIDKFDKALQNLRQIYNKNSDALKELAYITLEIVSCFLMVPVLICFLMVPVLICFVCYRP